VDNFRNAADSLAASERRLVAQSDALTELTARYTNPGEQFGDRLRSILEIAARAIDVERLSMWEFDPGHSLIRCVGLHHRTGSRYESGAVLPRTVAPAYFDAIERERVVAASEAQTDSRTREFRDGYLVPNNIGARMVTSGASVSPARRKRRRSCSPHTQCSCMTSASPKAAASTT